MNNASFYCLLKPDYLWQTSASQLPPRGQVGEVLHLLSCSGKSGVRQTQLFLETLLYNSSYRGFFFFPFSFNLKSFNLLEGRVNPQKDRVNLPLIVPHM